MLTTKHPFFPTFERLLREAASRPPVYDLGTSARFAKEVGLVRHLFDEQTYLAGGYKPEASPDRDGCDFDYDIQSMTGIADAVAGSVLCMSVLEHVEQPRKAVSEMARILRPGGIAVVSVPFFVGYHGKSGPTLNPVFDRSKGLKVDSRHSSYGDFWRFTHEGLALMFSEAGFRRVDVHPVDGPVISRLELLRIYSTLARLPIVSHLINRLDAPRLGGSPTMLFVRAEK